MKIAHTGNGIVRLLRSVVLTYNCNEPTHHPILLVGYKASLTYSHFLHYSFLDL